MKKLAQLVLQEQQTNQYKTISGYLKAAEKHFQQAKISPDADDILKFVAKEVADGADVTIDIINMEQLKKVVDKLQQSQPSED